MKLHVYLDQSDNHREYVATIDYFYEYNRTGLKLSPVYMDGKGNYKQKEKEVKSLISQYSKASKGNKSKVADIYNVAAAYDNSLADTQKILLRQSR